MPDYRTEAKRECHLLNIEHWRQLTGRKALNPDEEYWTLADDESFEVESLEQAEFLPDRSLFHACNDNEGKLKALAKKFPGINTHHGHMERTAGDFCMCPHGGIIYLDTTYRLDLHRANASYLLTVVMQSAGPGTLICANVIAQNVYNKKRLLPETFFKRVMKNFSDFSQWEPSSEIRGAIVHPTSGWVLLPTRFIPKKTSRTQMNTFFLWKRHE